jgi:catechol 2,3-dioxygenase-like lactoylglutathione lyase family enzyme
MLNKVTYVTLFVADQERALNFYTRSLGFEKRVDNPTPDGDRFLTVGIEGQDLQLVLWPGTPGGPKPKAGPRPGACIIQTDDCHKDFAALRARGVTFETDHVLEQPWAFVATLQDPDGNRITLRENRQVPGQK